MPACLLACVWCAAGGVQAVREGSWWTRGDTDSQLCELEGVNSLQQLAASVMGDDDDDDHHHALLAVEDDEDDEEQQPQAEEEEEAGQGSPAAAAAGTSAQQAGIAQQQQGSASPPRGVHAQGQPALRAVTAGFASSEEQQQYLELEREVAEMQKMLEEATAAAERGQQSHSDQQYLSEILGKQGCGPRPISDGGSCLNMLSIAGAALTACTTPPHCCGEPRTAL